MKNIKCFLALFYAGVESPPKSLEKISKMLTSSDAIAASMIQAMRHVNPNITTQEMIKPIQSMYQEICQDINESGQDMYVWLEAPSIYQFVADIGILEVDHSISFDKLTPPDQLLVSIQEEMIDDDEDDAEVIIFTAMLMRKNSPTLIIKKQK